MSHQFCGDLAVAKGFLKVYIVLSYVRKLHFQRLVNFSQNWKVLTLNLKNVLIIFPNIEGS
jgi:hypothetical protein